MNNNNVSNHDINNNCKPFGAPADPASITPVRMKYSVFRTIHLAFSLRMRMEMEREREMEMEMVIFGALKANWEVIYGELIFALKRLWTSYVEALEPLVHQEATKRAPRSPRGGPKSRSIGPVNGL